MSLGPHRRNVAELCDDTALDIEVLVAEIIRIGPDETDRIAERVLDRCRWMRRATSQSARALREQRKLDRLVWFGEDEPDDDPPAEQRIAA